MDTMKAVRIHSYGGIDELKIEYAPIPEISDDEILVRVEAAGVNPVDCKAREGYLKSRADYPMPFIPGWDFSGIVAKKGNKVTDFDIADEVYSRPDLSRNGAYAEYIAVKAAEVARKPRSLDHAHAAAVPLAGLTAWQVLNVANVQAGQTVLVHAAAGGVGTFAVQFAKCRGAKVIGTASASNRGFLEELGCERVIDHNNEKFEEVLKDIDVVIDTLGGEVQERSWSVLKKNGVLVSVITPPSQDRAREVGCRGEYHFVQPNRQNLEEIGSLIDAGKVRPILAAVLPLSEVKRAHEMIEAGHTRGKIVLRVATDESSRIFGENRAHSHPEEPHSRRAPKAAF